MWQFLRDIQYAFRVLRQSPGFGIAAVLTLALGIGANTAVFSLVNAVLLRPFPYPEPERLAFIWEDAPFFGLKDSPPAMGNYVDWRAQNRTFQEMGALERGAFRLTRGGEPELVRGSITTASLFRVLGAKPAIGREFRDDEDPPGGAKVVLVSDGLWRRRFGGDPSLVGKPIRLNEEQFTVVGVMPAGFEFPDNGNDLWVPVGAVFARSEFSNRDRHNLMVAGRLKAGVTLEQANEDIQAIARRLQQLYPRTNARVGAFVAPLREHFVAGVRRLLWILLAAVNFVLLIGCANIANLLLARGASRRKEIAVRAAMGAARARIVSQLLAESLLLAGAGAAAGLLLSIWSFQSLAKFIPNGISGAVSMDYRVLAFTAALSAATALLFGLAPALRASRLDLCEALKQSAGRSAVGGDGVRGLLVVSEVALAVVLLIGAGLLIRTYARLRGVDPGFRVENVLTVNTPVPFPRYRDAAKKRAFYEQTLARVRALPGVVSAGFINGVPVAFKGWVNSYLTEERPDLRLNANYRVVTSDYMRTMGIPLRQGRYLDTRDNAGAPLVALANETLASRFWPGQNAVGKRFRMGTSDPWITVAGVVGDVRQAGLDVPAKAEMYFPYEQQSVPPTSLVLRASGDPASLAAAVRREIHAVDPDVPVAAIRTMEEILDTEVSNRRLQTWLLGVFAGLALLLASLGVYGVLSYSVGRRTREIGLRLALGARPSDVLRSVLARGMLLAGLGVTIGLAAAFALTRLMSSLLYGVGATDPATFAGVSAVLLAVALVACSVPARRAARTDPMASLRHE
jgi:predicted permease